MGDPRHLRFARFGFGLFFHKKKRALILLELIIALSLTAILITFLFAFLVQNGKIEKKLEETRVVVLKRGHLQARLQTILSSLDQGSFDRCFYTEQSEKEKSWALMIQFDNGIDLDPSFSGLVFGKIYPDSENQLCLETWPLVEEEGKEKLIRHEILFPNAGRFEFEFLGPNRAPESGKKEILRSIQPNLAWRSHWPKSLGSSPSIIRLSVHETGTVSPIRYAFILPAPTPFVTYYRRAL